MLAASHNSFCWKLKWGFCWNNKDTEITISENNFSIKVKRVVYFCSIKDISPNILKVYSIDTACYGP